jgi:hypothetical protein
MEDIRIRYMNCQRKSDGKPYWRCSCEHKRDTFATGRRCPKCQKVWEDTQCPNEPDGYRQWSLHLEWYEHLDSALLELKEVLSEPEPFVQVTHSASKLWITKFLLLMVGMSLLQSANGQDSPSGIMVDTTITGFHFAINYSGTVVYTKNGPSDIDGKSQPTAFSVTVTKKASFDQAKKQVLDLFKLSALNNYEITGEAEKDTPLNGYRTYCIWYRETIKSRGYQNLVFNAVVQLDSSVLVFTSGDLDKGMYIEKMKKTFFKFTF